MSPGNGTSIHRLLRLATADMHAAVDAQFIALVSSGPAGYGHFLRGLASAIFALEPALEAAGAQSLMPDWTQRVRSPALQKDLADLGGAAPLLLPEPRLVSDAQTFGAMYVLEGSRLGAAYILRQLTPELSGRALMATRYLRHGEGLPLWSTFLQRLESSEDVLRDPSGTLDGANIAYSVFAEAAANCAHKEFVLEK